MIRAAAEIILSGERLVQLTRDTLMWTARGALVRRRRQVIEQLYEMGNRSVGFITITLGILGVITVFQALIQVEQILPDFTVVGPAFIQMMVREFGPTIAGLMIATRVGSGIAAEIGSMVVTEQVDALKMCNADPVDYLIAPRFIACTIQGLVMTVYATLVGILAGALTAYVFWNVDFSTFFNLQLVQFGDVVSGLVKGVAYGMAIPLVSGQAGLEAHGGSEGVGEATTRAVVNASFSVVILDLIISGISYLVLY